MSNQMLNELTAGRASGQGLATRLLTPLVRWGGTRLLNWEANGSIAVELPNGQQHRFGRISGEGEPLLRLHNYRVLANAVCRGSIGFAESYIDNDIDCNDLVGLFQFFIRNQARLEASGRAWFKPRVQDRLAHLRRRNSRRGSRRNISAHYDLGNEFYRLWLDPQLIYSSALFANGARTLDEAQDHKLALIEDMLNLSGNEHILEIGCGWGAMLRRLAQGQAASVTGITLSKQQLDHARAEVTAGGLSTRCDVRLQDYRDIDAQYDRVVSIEMIEAVGEEHWRQYFQKLYDCLKPSGTAVIQSITIDESRFDAYRKKADFIQRYIFPGGMLPTPTVIEQQAEDAGLALDRVERFGQCYARTLLDWRRNFEAAWPQIERLGFDEKFRRKWRYYLAYCEAGFREGVLDVGVYRLQKA